MACGKCGAKRGHLPGCEHWGIPTTNRKRGMKKRGTGLVPPRKKCPHNTIKVVKRKDKFYDWCLDCHNWIGGAP